VGSLPLSWVDSKVIALDAELLNQCSRIRYARTLKTVIPNKPTTVLKIAIRSGQTRRTKRLHNVTAAEPITVTPAPAAINTSMSLVLFKEDETP